MGKGTGGADAGVVGAVVVAFWRGMCSEELSDGVLYTNESEIGCGDVSVRLLGLFLLSIILAL